MTDAPSVTFLVDVDDTLLDNDRIRADLQAYLVESFSEELAVRYWAIQEQRFVDLGYRDYLGAVQEWWEAEGGDPRLLEASGYLLGYPFADRLYDRAPDVLAHLRSLGPTVVLTDGDAVFQPHKVARAGIAKAVAGNVLVYVHKELSLDDVERRYPAEHYVLVDDKLRILTAVKRSWGGRVTTVFPRQGHYARDPEVLATNPPADVTVERIGDLVQVELAALLAAARP
jgi:FMN phosphatase YigB (HAD superfamily)